MFCRNCGQKTKENAKFCSKCGTVIQNPQTIGTDEKPTVTAAPAIQVKAQEVEVMLNKKPKASKPTAHMMIAAAVVLIIAIGSISYAIFGSSPDYREAVAMMKSGLYSEAATAFTTLDPNYKDVDDKLAECKAMISYQHATDLMNSGSYSEAANLFISLGDFKDSAQLAQTCTNEATYQEAVAFMNSGDYETAKIKLTALGNFEDSKTLLAECEKGIQYNQAMALLQKGECEQAKAIFLSLGNFKDSAQMAENCNQSGAYGRAKALYDKGNYEEAKIAFTALGNYSDAKAMSVKCQNNIDYNKAVDLMKSGDKAGAEKIFTSLGSFKDSKALALDCKYSDDYEKAKTFIQQGNYTEAAKLLETPASVNYKDSKTLLSDCKNGTTTSSQSNEANVKSTYDQAVAAFNAGNYYTAYKLFTSISAINEKAAEFAKHCPQIPPDSYQSSKSGWDPLEIKINIISGHPGTFECSYVKFKTNYSGITIIKMYSGATLAYTIYINGFNDCTALILPGTYQIKVGYGKDWYGYKELVGDENGDYYTLSESSFFANEKKYEITVKN